MQKCCPFLELTRLIYTVNFKVSSLLQVKALLSAFIKAFITGLKKVLTTNEELQLTVIFVLLNNS